MAKNEIDKAAGAGTTDKMKGSAKKAMGKVEEGVGRAIGNTRMKNQGKADQAEGSAQKGVGKVKHAAQEAVDGVKDALSK